MPNHSSNTSVPSGAPAEGRKEPVGPGIAGRTERSSARTWASAVSTREAVLLVAGLLVVLQLALRAWALLPSWFYTDDYRLLHDARVSELGWDYLAEPFDSQFMPLGRLVAWFVESSGHVDWTLAASLTLMMQALASVACAWMLVTLFGARWGILAPLTLYLSTAITMPATMWWAASLNQLPLQCVLFASVATWLRYLRGRSPWWLAVTIGLLAIGLLAYVKTVLVLVLLAYLLLAYFTSGGPVARLRTALREYWPAAVAAVALGAAFSAYYVTEVPSIFQDADQPVAGDLHATMVGTSLTTGLVGGPWDWNTANPPVGYADPPVWAVSASWCVLLVLGLGLYLRRHRTGRAWLLLAGHTAAAYALLLTTRAPVVGALIGLEYRYLTDLAATATLCLGLAALPLRGATESSDQRPEPLLLVEPRARWAVAGVVLVAVSGVVSSVRYAHIWHEDNPGEDYTKAAMNGLAGRGTIDLADQVVPPDVIPGFSAPYNTTARLLPLLVDDVRFPVVSSRLVVLDDSGVPTQAELDVAVVSRPGPQEGCGWRIGGGGSVTVPLEGHAFEFDWWVRIGYLASGDDTLEVRVGDETLAVPVRRGVNNVLFRTDEGFSSLTLGGLPDGTTVCVDTVQVGLPIPGSPL